MHPAASPSCDEVTPALGSWERRAVPGPPSPGRFQHQELRAQGSGKRREQGCGPPSARCTPQWCPRLSPGPRSSLPEMPPQPGWQPMCPPQARLTGKAVMVTQKLRVRDEGPGAPAGVGSEQVGGGAGQRAAVPGSARSALLLGAVGLSLCVGTLSHSDVTDSL